MDIQDKLNKFKQIVVENCKNPDFIFREFFVKDHLIITERLALELCDIYSTADKNLVLALVWFHDFGKPLNINNERALTLEKGTEALKTVGFEENFINKIVKYWEIMEKKNELDLSQESIEVQIVSSADGAAHFIGKFYSTYFHDDSEEKIADIEIRLKKKIKQDWERKITLPEIKKLFKNRYLRALEITGEYPTKLLS